MVDFWMGGVDQRLFGPSATAPPEKIQRGNPNKDSGNVQHPHQEKKMTGITESDNIKPWCMV